MSDDLLLCLTVLPASLGPRPPRSRRFRHNKATTLKNGCLSFRTNISSRPLKSVRFLLTFIPHLKTTFCFCYVLYSTAANDFFGELCETTTALPLGRKKKQQTESENRVAASCFAHDVTADTAPRQCLSLLKRPKYDVTGASK